ncbi:hypothetical protein BCON_0318g00040 [Botryotinia convoluta]|uniref:Uncharacterized protein n=1 Tax=Botryotinia convoluta TaxID=54673 RepID=A0A4Z1HBY1_9HELO|nr:hypothetical protein BCON_0318g00040 [Botryotinia convoluta]
MVLPEPGEELGEKWCNRVSDIGFPISEDGMKLAQKFDGEQDKRHPISAAAYVFNDFTGHGFSEATENFLKDFDRDIHKKTVSPFTKWSYIEALAIFFKAGDTEMWMKFFDHAATDLDLNCQCETFQLCDEAGIDLTKRVRKQVQFSEKKFNDWRDQCKSKKEDFPEADDGNGYKFWAEKKKWKPEDDVKLNPDGIKWRDNGSDGTGNSRYIDNIHPDS